MSSICLRLWAQRFTSSRGRASRRAFLAFACFVAASCGPVATATAQSTTISVAPSLNCSIDSGPLASDCTNERLAVGLSDGTWGPPDEYRTLLRFDLSGKVPAGAEITSAQMKLWPDTQTVPPPSGTIVHAHMITSPWGVGVSWTNAATGTGWNSAGGDFDPEVESSWPQESLPARSQECCENGPAIWDVTRAVAKWHTGQADNYGVLLKTVTPDVNPTFYYSAQWGPMPMLEVTYIPDTTAPDLELDGDLRDFADAPLTGHTYEIWGDATDTQESGAIGSGVKSVELRLDGARVAFVEAPCDEDDCDLDVSWDFIRDEHPVGHHVMSATAIDRAGNAATDSFEFDLSAEQVEEPPDDGLLAAPTASGLAPGGRYACTSADDRGAFGDVRDVRSRKLPLGVGETTVAHTDGSYVTIRCDRDGNLIEKQRVGPIETPGGPRMVPYSRTVPGESGDWYTTSYSSYDDPRAPRHARTWRHDIDRLTAQALPPTPGIRLAGPLETTLAGDERCQKDTDPNYDEHAWGGDTWRYHIDRSSFPVTYRTVRGRDRVQERIRDGIRTWNEGRNGCGYGPYKGFHTAMQSGSDPGGRDEDHSVIEFVDEVVCNDPDDPPGGITKGCTRVTEDNYTIVVGEGIKIKAKSADIEFRASGPWWTGKGRKRVCRGQLRTDLWAMAAHEVGHVVGLDDSLSSSAEWWTMYEFTEACDVQQRSLNFSDRKGLKRLTIR